jgi:hypothetical protein
MDTVLPGGCQQGGANFQEATPMTNFRWEPLKTSPSPIAIGDDGDVV